MSPILEEEPAKKPKKAKKPAKKSTTMPTTGVVIRDTPGVSVLKKKEPAKVDRGKGMDLLSDAALLEAAQVKEALKKSKKDSHMLHASGSCNRVGSQPKVLDDPQDKTTGTNEGIGTKLGVPDVPKEHSESENESWGNSKDNDSDDVSKHDDDDDDDADSDDDGDNDANDSKRTDSDEEENLNLNLKDDEEEESQDDEEFDKEEYDELYKDVNVRSKDTEHEKEGKGDAEMTNAYQDVSQEKSYEQVRDDAHVTLTATHKTEGSMQSSSFSSDFASKFLNLDNVPPADNDVTSMMNVKVHQEESITQSPFPLTVPVTVIPKTSTVTATTVPPTIQPFTPILQQSPPTPALTTEPTTTLIHALLDFSSLFGFDQRVSTLEKELSQIKQVD
ncbi:hypothetical protein Tco_0155898 [Tanacetum coccineum]